MSPQNFAITILAISLAFIATRVAFVGPFLAVPHSFTEALTLLFFSAAAICAVVLFLVRRQAFDEDLAQTDFDKI